MKHGLWFAVDSPLCLRSVKGEAERKWPVANPLEKFLSLICTAAFIRIEQVLQASASSFLNLLPERRNLAHALVSSHTLHTPHWKEQIGRPQERLIARNSPHPILKRIQVNSPEKHPGSIDFIKHAPTLLARAVQYENDHRAGLNSFGKILHIYHILFASAHASRPLSLHFISTQILKEGCKLRTNSPTFSAMSGEPPSFSISETRAEPTTAASA